MFNTDGEKRSGMFDIHCHLLPGIDDGCRNEEESLTCIRRLIERGFSGSICTPHIWGSMFPRNTPDLIADLLDHLRQAIEEEGLDYQVWGGGEIRIAPDVFEWLDAHGVNTLADSSFVLCDMWEPTWPDYATGLLEQWIDEGYHPVLAHPERMLLDDKAFDAAIARLKEMGVRLQGNVNSLTGGEGAQAATRLRRLIHAGDIWCMGLDLHGPNTLASRMEGLAFAEMEAGPEQFHRFFTIQPGRILNQKTMGEAD